MCALAIAAVVEWQQIFRNLAHTGFEATTMTIASCAKLFLHTSAITVVEDLADALQTGNSRFCQKVQLHTCKNGGGRVAGAFEITLYHTSVGYGIKAPGCAPAITVVAE